MPTKHLIFNTIIPIAAQLLRLQSGLLLAVQIRWLKNLQLLEILFSYFNTLCRGKSLTLHLCKMYEREVCLEGAKRQYDVLETPLSFSERLSLKEMVVVRLIASDSKISIASITSKTGMSKRTIDRIIAVLKDKGIIAREGAKNNATWIIISPKK